MATVNFGFQWYIDYFDYVYREQDDIKPGFYRVFDDESLWEDINYFIDTLKDLPEFRYFYATNRYETNNPIEKVLLTDGRFVIGTMETEWAQKLYITESPDIYNSPHRNEELGKEFEKLKQLIQEAAIDCFPNIWLRHGPWISLERAKEQNLIDSD